MAKDKSKNRQGVTPTTSSDLHTTTEEWKDDEAEAEVKSSDAETRAKIKAQSDTRAEVDSMKEGFFDKAVGAVKHALHLDEPKHLSHATPSVDDPRVKEAHRVDLGDEAKGLQGKPINKVPGKLRKFVSQ